jgi:hypothetical protein
MKGLYSKVDPGQRAPLPGTLTKLGAELAAKQIRAVVAEAVGDFAHPQSCFFEQKSPGAKVDVLGGASYQSWSGQKLDPPMFKSVD